MSAPSQNSPPLRSDPWRSAVVPSIVIARTARRQGADDFARGGIRRADSGAYRLLPGDDFRRFFKLVRTWTCVGIAGIAAQGNRQRVDRGRAVTPEASWCPRMLSRGTSRILQALRFPERPGTRPRRRAGRCLLRPVFRWPCSAGRRRVPAGIQGGWPTRGRQRCAIRADMILGAEDSRDRLPSIRIKRFEGLLSAACFPHRQMDQLTNDSLFCRNQPRNPQRKRPTSL